MAFTYTKLDSALTESTVWREPYHVRILWVAMLAMADKDGEVRGSVPGLAARANILPEEARDALARFIGPDAESRSPEFDGRRIEKIDGGWRLLNHAKYRDQLDGLDRREYFRQHKANTRAKQKEEAPAKPARRQKKPQVGVDPKADNSFSLEDALAVYRTAKKKGLASYKDCPADIKKILEAEA